MRGRVNIPPRTGGIVNGVVREYQVVEEGGISTGDYVEFGIQNSNMQLVVPYSSITDSRKPTGILYLLVMIMMDQEINFLSFLMDQKFLFTVQKMLSVSLLLL